MGKIYAIFEIITSKYVKGGQNKVKCICQLFIYAFILNIVQISFICSHSTLYRKVGHTAQIEFQPSINLRAYRTQIRIVQSIYFIITLKSHIPYKVNNTSNFE